MDAHETPKAYQPPGELEKISVFVISYVVALAYYVALPVFIVGWLNGAGYPTIAIIVAVYSAFQFIAFVFRRIMRYLSKH